MLDKNRLINNFMDMVRIDSPSNQELEMSKWLVNYLKERNIDAIIDDAGEKYGGNTGNVIAYIKVKKEVDHFVYVHTWTKFNLV